jgi:hypothetical protein
VQEVEFAEAGGGGRGGGAGGEGDGDGEVSCRAVGLGGSATEEVVEEKLVVLSHGGGGGACWCSTFCLETWSGRVSRTTPYDVRAVGHVEQ